MRARTDRNHAEIARALRAIGATVVDLSAVGKGLPDLLCGYQGRTVLIEVKDGAKSESRRPLTEAQLAWHRDWRGGPVAVVTDVEGAIRALRTAD